MKRLCLFLILICLTSPVRAAEPIRFSTWYWLNAADRTQWESDFKVMAETGFTDVMLCWGLDAAAVATQTNNTRLALDLCQKHGLKGYLLVWHPAYNKLPRDPRFQQVDNQGNLLFTFNVFHREWRSTQWRHYLQTIAAAYQDHPAFAGYLFDDTFHVGQIGSLLGDKTKKRGDFVGYSNYDFEQFRVWLKGKYGSLPALNAVWKTKFVEWQDVAPPNAITEQNAEAWQDWCAARLAWLKDWATDTVGFIREVDASPKHEILLEDGEYVLGRPRKSGDSFRPITLRDSIGLSFGEVVKSFDSVCVYSTFTWDKTNALESATNKTEQILRELRTEVGGDKKIISAFWVADANLNKPPSDLPNAGQIAAITAIALKTGIRHVNYYGFRIGDWRVTDAEWNDYRSNDFEYQKTKPLTGRFLCDKPELLRQLKKQM